MDGIITITTNGIVITFNAAAEGIFSYRADKVIGRNISRLIQSSYALEHEDYLTKFLRTSTPQIIGIGREVKGLRADG